MNLWVVLSVLAFFGSSGTVTGASTNSTSPLSLIVRIYRTTGANTHLQQFNISLSEFSSILQKLSGSLRGLNNTQLTTQLSTDVKQLQQTIPKIIKNTQDRDSITILSASLLRLINGLSNSKNPDLLSSLKQIESSFASKKAPVVYSPARKARLRKFCRRLKASNSSKSSVVRKSAQRTIVVRVNITAKTQVQNLNRTLTTLVRKSTNPELVKILNQLIDTLTSYTKTRDPSKLIQIMQSTLQLTKQNPSDKELSSVASNLVTFVNALLGSSRSIARSSPLSQLIAYLTGLTKSNLLSVPQADKILSTLAKNGVNDGGSLLQTLIGILRPLSSKIPSRINGTAQPFLRELYRFPNDQGQPAVERLVKALQNLEDDVLKYNGSDQNAIIDVIRLIITVLLSVLSDNQYATGALQSLLPPLKTPAVSSGQRQQPRQCDPRMRGLVDLGAIVCTVENVLVGPSGNAGLVGTVTNLLGGVLGGNSGGLLTGGNSGELLTGGNSGELLTGGNSQSGNGLLGGLLGGIVGGNRWATGSNGNQNSGLLNGLLGRL